MAHDWIFYPPPDDGYFQQGLPEAFPLDQSVNPTGIATGEAFGTPAINNIFPTGIGTGEAFGTLQVNTQIYPTGIATGEVFGTLHASFFEQTVSPTGIASGEAFGSDKIDLQIYPTGIATGEATGTPNIQRQINLSGHGIPTGEAFGSDMPPSISLIQRVATSFFLNGTSPTLSGITATTPGNLLVCAVSTANSSIDPGFTFGLPAGWVLLESEIRNNGSAAQAQVNLWYYPNNPGGITSVQVTGLSNTVSTQMVVMEFAASDGSTLTLDNDNKAGDDTQTEECDVVVTYGYGELVVFFSVGLFNDTGSPTFASGFTGAVTAHNSSNTSYDAYDLDVLAGVSQPTVDPSVTGTQSWAAASASFYSGPFHVDQKIYPTGIATGEAFGGLQINDIFPAGIPTGETFGTADVYNFNQYVYPNGIPTGEAFGTVLAGSPISPTGIASEEAFGEPLVYGGSTPIQVQTVCNNTTDMCLDPAFTVTFDSPTKKGTTLFIGVSAIVPSGSFGITGFVAPDGWVAVADAVFNPNDNSWTQGFYYTDNPGGITQVEIVFGPVNTIFDFSPTGWTVEQGAHSTTGAFLDSAYLGWNLAVPTGTVAVYMGDAKGLSGSITVWELANVASKADLDPNDASEGWPGGDVFGGAALPNSHTSTTVQGVGYTSSPFGFEIVAIIVSPTWDGNTAVILEGGGWNSIDVAPSPGFSVGNPPFAAVFANNTTAGLFAASNAQGAQSWGYGFWGVVFAPTAGHNVEIVQSITIPANSVTYVDGFGGALGVVVLPCPTQPGSALVAFATDYILDTEAPQDVSGESALSTFAARWNICAQEWAAVGTWTVGPEADVEDNNTTSISTSTGTIITSESVVFAWIESADGPDLSTITPDGSFTGSMGGVDATSGPSVPSGPGGGLTYYINSGSGNDITSAPTQTADVPMTQYMWVWARGEIHPGGIPTGEAVGTVYVVQQPHHIEPVGIPSGEAFGNILVTAATIDLGGFGIPSGEAFGTIFVSPHWMYMEGIPSGEAFGLPRLYGPTQAVFPTGIPSGEVFGNVTLPRYVDGIPSGEAFGIPDILAVQTVNPTGIPSGEAFGVPHVVRLYVQPTGIPSGEAFGSLEILLLDTGGHELIQPYGIPSGEAFGTVKLNQKIYITGWIDNGLTAIANESPLAPDAQLGNPTVTQSSLGISPVGIPSGEAFGAFAVVNIGLVTNPPSMGSLSGQPSLFVEDPPQSLPVYDYYARTGIKNLVTGIWHRTMAGSEDTFEFSFPTNAPENTYAIDNVVNIPYIAAQPLQDGNFKIRKKVTKLDEQGVNITTYTGESNHYELGFMAGTPYKSVYGTTAYDVLTCILHGTGWSIGTIDPLVIWQDLTGQSPAQGGVSGASDETLPNGDQVINGVDLNMFGFLCQNQIGPNYQSSRASVLTQIMQVAQIWGGFIQFDESKKTVSLLASWPGSTGIIADATLNLKSYSVTQSKKPNAQILIVEGANGAMSGLSASMILAELTIADACDQQLNSYLESQLPNPCDNGAPGFVMYVSSNQMEMFREQIYEAFLLQQGVQVTYDAAVVDLSTLPGYESYVLHMGDWLTIIDSANSISGQVLTVEENYDLIEPWLSTYTFSNEIPWASNMNIGLMPAPIPPKSGQAPPGKPIYDFTVPVPLKSTTYDCIASAATDAGNMTGPLDGIVGHYQGVIDAANQAIDAYSQNAQAFDGKQSGQPDLSMVYKPAIDSLKNVVTVADGRMKLWSAVQSNPGQIQADANNIATLQGTIQDALDSCDAATQAGGPPAIGFSITNALGMKALNDELAQLQAEESAQHDPQGPTSAIGGAIADAGQKQCQSYSYRSKTTTYCGDLEVDLQERSAFKAWDSLKASASSIPIDAATLQASIQLVESEIQCLQSKLDNQQSDMTASMAACADNGSQSDPGSDPVNPDAGAVTTAVPQTPDSFSYANGLINAMIQAAGYASQAALAVESHAINIITIQQNAATALTDVTDGGPVADPPPFTTISLPDSAENAANLGVVLVTDLKALLNVLETFRENMTLIRSGNSVNADMSTNVNANDPSTAVLIVVAQIQKNEAATAWEAVTNALNVIQTDITNLSTQIDNLGTNSQALRDGIRAWITAIGAFNADLQAQGNALITCQGIPAELVQVQTYASYFGGWVAQLKAQASQLSDGVNNIDGEYKDVSSDVEQQTQQNQLSQNTPNIMTPNTTDKTPYDITYDDNGNGAQRITIGPTAVGINKYDVHIQTPEGF